MRTKENKGVTLIALAVTVIVLLIISGVTISYMTGENGIINQSKESKNFLQYSQVRQFKMAMKMKRMSLQRRMRKKKVKKL